MVAARSITKPTIQTNNVRILAFPDELTISNRRAEAALHQLIRNCSSLVADFHHGFSGDDLIPYNSVCAAYQYGVKETVEYLILRCSGRAMSRRKYIGRKGAKTVRSYAERNLSRCSDSGTMRNLLESNFKR